MKTARAQLKVYRQALLKHAFEGKLTTEWREQNKDKLETAEALQKRIQQERAQHYQQKLADWQAAGQTASKPKTTKSLPPLTAEALAELPKGWGWARFGFLGEWSGGGTPSKAIPEYWESAVIPWVSPKDMKATFIYKTQDNISQHGVLNSPAKLIPCGSILFVVRSGICVEHSLSQ